MSQKTARIAIRNGIGKRLLELGFQRKSTRLYVREDEQFSEWVGFSIDGYERVNETIGIFDKDFAALFASMPHYEDVVESTDVWGDPAPAHVHSGALELWRDEADEKVNAEIDGWRWWQREAWFGPKPTPEYMLSPFVIDGAWETATDPDGVAEFMLEHWRARVEPWRERMLTDKAAFAARYRWSVNITLIPRIVSHIYGGDPAEAARICGEYISEMREPPVITPRREKRKILDDAGMTEAEYLDQQAQINAALIDKLLFVVREFKLGIR